MREPGPALGLGLRASEWVLYARASVWRLGGSVFCLPRCESCLCNDPEAHNTAVCMGRQGAGSTLISSLFASASFGKGLRLGRELLCIKLEPSKQMPLL